MDNNEDYVKQQINALIHVQDNLCPELFSASQKLRPEVREVILNIVEFAGELVRETFKQVKLKDVLICGSCAGYLYLQQSEIDVVLLWEMPAALQSPEDFEEKLKLGNGGYRNRGQLRNLRPASQLCQLCNHAGRFRHLFRYAEQMAEFSGKKTFYLFAERFVQTLC